MLYMNKTNLELDRGKGPWLGGGGVEVVEHRAEKGKIERNRRNREVFDFYKMNSRPVKNLRSGNQGCESRRQMNSSCSRPRFREI